MFAASGSCTVALTAPASTVTAVKREPSASETIAVSLVPSSPLLGSVSKVTSVPTATPAGSNAVALTTGTMPSASLPVAVRNSIGELPPSKTIPAQAVIAASETLSAAPGETTILAPARLLFLSFRNLKAPVLTSIVPVSFADVFVCVIQNSPSPILVRVCPFSVSVVTP